MKAGEKLSATAKMVVRGCGTLPVVGEHPGTFWLIGFALIGLMAGGWRGLLLMLVPFLPLYLVGAYERAKFSDRQKR